MSTSLNAALLAAQKAIRPVPKDETAEVKNKEGKFLYKYNFVSTEQMIIVCRGALHDAGLFTRRVSFKIDNETRPPTLHSTFRVTHAESGEHEDSEMPMPIAGTGSADKAVTGAATYAWAYYLRDLLCIARAEDEEHAPDKRKDEGAGFNAPQATSRKTTKAEPKKAAEKVNGKPQPNGRGVENKACRAAHAKYYVTAEKRGVTARPLESFLAEVTGKDEAFLLANEAKWNTNIDAMAWDKAAVLISVAVAQLPPPEREPGDDSDETMPESWGDLGDCVEGGAA